MGEAVGSIARVNGLKLLAVVLAASASCLALAGSSRSVNDVADASLTDAVDRSCLRADQMPDDVDWGVIHHLHDRVRAWLREDPEWALEHTLRRAQMQERAGTVWWAREIDQDGWTALFADMHMPAGVAPSEWYALRNSEIGARAEGTESAQFTLLDLDDDGDRDLVVDLLWSDNASANEGLVFRQQNGRFRPCVSSADPNADASLYLTQGRGAAQRVQWIRSHDRTYAAYISSWFGWDRVRLLRPFSDNRWVLAFDVQYAYAWSLPRKQPGRDTAPAYDIPSTIWRSLSRALRRATRQPLIAESNTGARVCRISSRRQAAGDSSMTGSFGPGHPLYETVRDFGVTIEGRCHPARLLSHFGAYSFEKGLAAEILIRREAAQESYTVNARRRIISVDRPVLVEFSAGLP
jgi:hypothetical protein